MNYFPMIFHFCQQKILHVFVNLPSFIVVSKFMPLANQTCGYKFLVGPLWKNMEKMAVSTGGHGLI